MMHAFKDSLERSWEVVVDLFTIEKVLAHTGVDVFDVQAVCQSMPVFTHVLYWLCSDQTEGKVSEREFFRGMKPEVFDAMRAAYRDELVFFCPMEQKESYRKMFELSESVTAKTLDILRSQSQTAMEQAASLDTDEVAKTLAKELLREALKDSATNSPARSGLTRVG